MANQEHLDILKQGVEVWNEWRETNRYIKIDLSKANLSEFDLINVDLSEANLRGAYIGKNNLSGACLKGANLTWAHLSGANLNQVDLSGSTLNRAHLSYISLIEANLSGATLIKADLNRAHLMGTDLSGAILSGAELIMAILSGANLCEAHLNRANLSHADMIGANLSRSCFNGALLFSANLINTNLTQANLSGADLSGSNLSYANLYKANLTGCRVHAVSTWNIQLVDTIQLGLVITHQDEPAITVDNLEVSQFIYLLLNNQKIRDVIDTITSKVVLILGRFTPERKRVLDALRDELRKKDYLPIVFDFQKPANRDLTETVSTLAHMARFVIADITDPKSIPQELKTIVPHLPSVVVQPLLHARSKEYGMFEYFKSFPWVLEAYRYTTVDRLLASLKEHVIEPAERKVRELAIEKAKQLEIP